MVAVFDLARFLMEGIPGSTNKSILPQVSIRGSVNSSEHVRTLHDLIVDGAKQGMDLDSCT